MKARMVFVTMILPALVGTLACSGLRVHQDFDRHADFARFQTYTWQDDEASLQNVAPLTHQRLVAAVDQELTSKGLRKVDANPDLCVKYMADEKQQLQVGSNPTGYGVGPGF